MSTQTLDTPASLNPAAVIEKSVIIFKDADKILMANQERSDKALAVGRKILADIADNGGKMTAELDARCNNYLANIRKASSEMNDARSPVTQIMDALKKMYTEIENKLDLKKPETIPAIIHAKRNDYARDVFQEQERQRLEAEKKAAIEKKKNDLAAWITNAISSKLINYLQDKKIKMNQSFNEITLDDIDTKSASLSNMKCSLPEDKVADIIKYDVPYEFTSLGTDACALVSVQTKTAYNFQNFYEQYTKEVGELKQQLIDRLPSKKTELQEMAEQKRLQEENDKKLAAAKNEKQRLAAIQKQQELEAEKKKLEEAAEQRKLEEANRIKKEADDARLKAEQETESKRVADNTMLLFDQASAVDNTPAPEARQGYEIIVTHQAGYVEIFQLWFANEGTKATIDEIGKKTLNQMKKYCEDLAHKHNSRIESKYLKYEPKFTAVNRKTK